MIARPRIALFQPDIPHNTGAILRLAACLQVGVDIIEPTGFRLDAKGLRRAGMDYLEIAAMRRHADWETFCTGIAAPRRLVLLTTHGDASLYEFNFDPSDILLFGRESSGVPEDVHQAASARIVIPMAANARSLNLAICAGMAIGEALRQTQGLASRASEARSDITDA